MDERPLAPTVMSPYRHFTRSEWAALRADTPLTLTIDDLARLQSMNDPISVEEVVAIYLPLSRLLALYVAATQGLYKATQRFLGAEDGKVPPRDQLAYLVDDATGDVADDVLGDRRVGVEPAERQIGPLDPAVEVRRAGEHVAEGGGHLLVADEASGGA